MSIDRDVIVIGAGLTGLACAAELGPAAMVLERSAVPGGLCGSVVRDGFTWDYSGHFLHLRRPEVRSLIQRTLRVPLHTIERDAWVRFRGRWVPYPFQAHLYHVPPQVRAECLSAVSRRPAGRPRPGMPFDRWCTLTFGAGITRYFMRPYNEKLWTVPSGELTADWCAPFVPRPTAAEILRGARVPAARAFGYNARFHYPRAGGCQAIVDAFAARAATVYYRSPVVRVDHLRRTVRTKDGTTYRYHALVSTQPLPALLDQMDGLPAPVRAARERLRWNTVTCYNVAVRRGGREPLCGGRHWIYVPEKRFPFYRVGIYDNIIPGAVPAGYSALYVEVSGRAAPRRPLARAALAEQLSAVGVLGAGDRIVDVLPLVMPCAYVIFDENHARAVAVAQAFLEGHGIRSIGRYGAWEYSFMEKNIIDGRTAARALKG